MNAIAWAMWRCAWLWWLWPWSTNFNRAAARVLSGTPKDHHEPYHQPRHQ